MPNDNTSFHLDFPILNEGIYEGSVHDLDHVLVKERQRMLLAWYFILIVSFSVGTLL